MMGRQVPRTYKILVDKSEGMTPLGILMYRWKENIKANFQTIS
jgi:hypothetical protein